MSQQADQIGQRQRDDDDDDEYEKGPFIQYVTH